MNEYQNHMVGQNPFNQPTGTGNSSGSLITPELLHSFIVEVKGYLPRLEAGIAEFFQQPAAMERLAEAHGYAHTIRKAAQVIGLMPLGNIAERLQLLLEKLAIGGLPLDATTYYGFQQIVAQIGIYLDHSAVGGALPPTALVEAIHALENQNEFSAEPAPAMVAAPMPEPASPPQIYVLSDEYGETQETAAYAQAEDAPAYFAEPTVSARNSERLSMPDQLAQAPQTPQPIEAYEAQPVNADLPPVYALTPEYDTAHPAESSVFIEAQPIAQNIYAEAEPAVPNGYQEAPPEAAPVESDVTAAQPEWWSQAYVQEAAQVAPNAITTHLEPLPVEIAEPLAQHAPASNWPSAGWAAYDQGQPSEAAAVNVPIEVPMSVVAAYEITEGLRTTAELPAIHLPLGAFGSSVESSAPAPLSGEAPYIQNSDQMSGQLPDQILDQIPEPLPIPPPPPAPPIYPPAFKTAAVFEEAMPHWQVVSQDETPTQELPSILPAAAPMQEVASVQEVVPVQEPVAIPDLPIEPVFQAFAVEEPAPAPVPVNELRVSSRLAERLGEPFAPEPPMLPANDHAAFWMSASGSLSATTPHTRSDWAVRYAAQAEERSANNIANSVANSVLADGESEVAVTPSMSPETQPEAPISEAAVEPLVTAPLVAMEAEATSAPVTETNIPAIPSAMEKFISWEGEERARTSFDAATVWGPRPSAELALPTHMPKAARDPFAELLDQLMPPSEPRSLAPVTPVAAINPQVTPFAFAESQPLSAPVVTDDFSDFQEEVAEAPSAPVATTSSSDWDVPAELLEVFLPEAEEHLTVITTSLPKLASQPENKALLQEIRRSSHSLKGSSAVVGFHGITKLAHRMEDMLDLLYDGEMKLTSEMLDLLFSSTEALDNLLNSKSEPELIDSLYAAYDRLLSGHTEADASVPQAQITPFALAEQINETESAALPVADFVDEFDAEPVAEPTAELVAVAPSIAITSNSLPLPLVAVLNEVRAQAAPVMELPPIVTALPVSPMAEPPARNVKETAVSAISRGNYVRVPIEKLDSVVKLVTELIVNRATLEQNMGQFVRQLEELRGNAQRLSRVANRMEVQYEASTLGSGLQAVKAGGGVFTNALSESGKTNGSSAAGLTAKLASPVMTSNTYGFDALEFDRYTEFHLLLRELTECAGDMQTMERELRTIREYFESALNRQGRLNSEMQDQLMRLRMIPLASLASRLHRTAHQVAQQRNKQVNFIIEGEDTRLDKTVIEEISDPLLHILRNAIDHGIEYAPMRQAAGKAPQGTVRLRAFHEGTQTVIQIIDDGAGLQPERLRAKAIQTGVVSAADAAKLTDDELFALIFLPGFSTAAEISEISGRGVGMDIVKTTIQRLKGRIDLDSRVGVGTVFTIRLPMTLAVMRALLVKAHKQTFAIPPVGLQQIVKLTPEMLDRVGEQHVIRVNNKIYPLMQLGRLLNLKRSATKAEGAQLALLMSLDDRQFAIAVDETLGGRDVVVKNLGNHIREVRGITGTTLMGDGSAVLILNLPELVRDSLRPASALTARLTGQQQPVVQRPRVRPPVEQRGPLNIMVVDDSLSVRRVLANRLNAVGWKPIQAKDGLDALEQLQHIPRLPDTILLDIEMPRMDGYEFLSALRKNPDYANIPVVMITSRAGQKHRDRAYEAGANEYLVKPYQDEQLLTLIRRLAQVTE